jgi:hypothetical protein
MKYRILLVSFEHCILKNVPPKVLHNYTIIHRVPGRACKRRVGDLETRVTRDINGRKCFETRNEDPERADEKEL